MRDTPASLNSSIASEVSSGVALGVTLVRSPIFTAYLANSYRSGRFSGSPPVNTISGSPNERISSSRRYPWSVVNSFGWRSDWAEARQCTQARSQAWVTSQITSIGD